MNNKEILVSEDVTIVNALVAANDPAVQPAAHHAAAPGISQEGSAHNAAAPVAAKGLAHLLIRAVRVLVDWAGSREGLRARVRYADGSSLSLPTLDPTRKPKMVRGELRPAPCRCSFKNLLEIICWVRQYADESVEIYVERGWENKNDEMHDRCVEAAGILPTGERRLREFDGLRTKNVRGRRRKDDDGDVTYIDEAVANDVRYDAYGRRHRTVSYGARLTTEKGGLHPDILRVIEEVTVAQNKSWKNEGAVAAKAWLKAHGYKGAPKVGLIQAHMAAQVITSKSGFKLWLRAKGPTRALIENNKAMRNSNPVIRKRERELLHAPLWGVFLAVRAEISAAHHVAAPVAAKMLAA